MVQIVAWPDRSFFSFRCAVMDDMFIRIYDTFDNGSPGATSSTTKFVGPGPSFTLRYTHETFPSSIVRMCPFNAQTLIGKLVADRLTKCAHAKMRETQITTLSQSAAVHVEAFQLVLLGAYVCVCGGKRKCTQSRAHTRNYAKHVLHYIKWCAYTVAHV